MPDLTALSEDERRDLVQQAIALSAVRFGGQGFNCAESVLYGVGVALGLPCEAVAKIATPFGGGIGRAGSLCGALSGAVMALGLVTGRTTPDTQQRDTSYAHARRLWQRFTERAGAEDCRDLKPQVSSHDEQRAACARFVALAAELAAEELLGL